MLCTAVMLAKLNILTVRGAFVSHSRAENTPFERELYHANAGRHRSSGSRLVVFVRLSSRIEEPSSLGGRRLFLTVST